MDSFIFRCGELSVSISLYIENACYNVHMAIHILNLKKGASSALGRYVDNVSPLVYDRLASPSLDCIFNHDSRQKMLPLTLCRNELLTAQSDICRAR